VKVQLLPIVSNGGLFIGGEDLDGESITAEVTGVQNRPEPVAEFSYFSERDGRDPHAFEGTSRENLGEDAVKSLSK
jgi:hypothetical protein